MGTNTKPNPVATKDNEATIKNIQLAAISNFNSVKVNIDAITINIAFKILIAAITDLHRNKVKVGIATSSSFNNINRLLTTCIGRSWQDAFNEIETSDSTPAKKPDPSVYKNIISRLNVNPKYSIAIEDTPNGLQSANCAGLKTVVTVHEMTRNLDFPNAALVVDSIGTYEQPFKLIKGESFGFNYVSIGLLSKLIE